MEEGKLQRAESTQIKINDIELSAYEIWGVFFSGRKIIINYRIDRKEVNKVKANANY